MTRIQLFASVAVLTIPPALAARMAVTIDSISRGCFGINIVSGWQRAEYTRMGIWPGAEHSGRRYEYCAEYVTVMRELWATGRSDFKGVFFKMEDCRCSRRSRSLVRRRATAGQSLLRSTAITISVRATGSTSRHD
jgi:pyrimidine oxygenase